MHQAGWAGSAHICVHMSEEHIPCVKMGPPMGMLAGSCPLWAHMSMEVSHHACTSHPIHGEVNPQGVMQLVQELHKALFLGRQKRRRLNVSRDLGVECSGKRWLPYWLRAYYTVRASHPPLNQTLITSVSILQKGKLRLREK